MPKSTVRYEPRSQDGEQPVALTGGIASGSARNVMGVHVYSFGGVVRTAEWMNARITARG